MARKPTKTDKSDIGSGASEASVPDSLSLNQRQAIELLASGMSDAEAAAIVGIARTTISKWRATGTAFADAERAAEDEAVARTRRRLRSLTARAVDTIASVMDGKRTDPATGEESFNADPQHRLAAAKTVLDRAGVAELKGVELTGANGGPVALDVRATLLEAAKGLTDAELFPEDGAEPKP